MLVINSSLTYRWAPSSCFQQSQKTNFIYSLVGSLDLLLSRKLVKIRRLLCYDLLTITIPVSHELHLLTWWNSGLRVGHILRLTHTKERDFPMRQDFTSEPSFLAAISSWMPVWSLSSMPSCFYAFSVCQLALLGHCLNHSCTPQCSSDFRCPWFFLLLCLDSFLMPPET